eukprot:GHRR01002923.1.p1 GENE.GHRR01002923.1~~GHRR01002923.1.p1  ORF type:complete len:338 (+),score=69.67 GHRR01002923.1:93-1106(+)
MMACSISSSSASVLCSRQHSLGRPMLQYCTVYTSLVSSQHSRFSKSNRHGYLLQGPRLACARARVEACTSSRRNRRRPQTLRRAYEPGSSGKDPSLEEYVEVKIESVKTNQGSSIVYLRVVGSEGLIPVHIGESESSALLREINKHRQVRPLTHDLMKNMLQSVGSKVTKVRITDIIANTYYARVYMLLPGTEGNQEVDIDARPSDAINIAIRFGAPVYISKKIADVAAHTPVEFHSITNESNAEIARSVREALANYEDPTIMYQLQKDLAVQEERFEDAHQLHQHIVHEMTHNRILRLVVAMESALADGRYEEAAYLRNEYRKAVQQSQTADRNVL